MFCRSRTLPSYIEPKTHLCKIRVICMSEISTLLSHHCDQLFALAILFCIDNVPNVACFTNDDSHSPKRRPVIHSALSSHDTPHWSHDHNPGQVFCAWCFFAVILRRFTPWMRCPWCSRYRRRKWTRRYEFKSWTRPIAFHIALIPLGKVWIQLLSLQLWVNSRTD